MLHIEKKTDFRSLFESASDLILVLLPDLTIHAVSDAYANATFTKQEDIIGKYFFDVFPDNPNIINGDEGFSGSSSMNFVLKNKIAHSMAVQQLNIRRPDGAFEERYWILVNKPVLNSKNEVDYIIHHVEDVTDFIHIQNEQTEIEKITSNQSIRSDEMDTEIFKHSQEIQKINNELEQEVVERTARINKDILDYKFALDESSIIAITDQKGIILHVNDNFCKISKYTKEELIGQDHRIINSGYHSKEFIRDLWVTIAKGNTWKGEIRNKAKDGTFYWVDTTIVPFLNQQGKPYKYLAIRSDITQRILSFEELKTSEEKYRNLYENSVVSIYSTDMRTLKVIDVNDKGVQIFGYKSKEDFIDNYTSSAHFVNLADKEESIEILKEKGEIRDRVQEMKTLDGTHFWAKVFIKLNAEKSLAQVVLIDVTEQIRSHNELQASEENYRNLYENTLVAMFTTNIKTFKITEVNDVGVQLFGYKSKEDFVENYDVQVHLVDLSILEKNLETLKEKGEIKSGVQEMKKLDGTHFWIKLFAKKNSENYLVQFVLIDITQQIHFQEELEAKVKERTLELTESLKREKESNDMKSHFVSMASHEFRTPLSTILSSTYLIEKYTETEQQEKRLMHVNRISSSVRNLTDTLNDFLSLAQLEKGIVVANSTIFNLPEFLGTVIDEIAEMLRKKNQRIEYYHDGGEIIEQSGKIIKNILLNLLSNASKYSPKDKDILLTSSVANNLVTITVKDFGIGIPEEDQKNLFTEFFRAKNVENIQGTGLGLIIVKKYVELLDGNISFLSNLNEGASFTIEFPLHKIIR